MTFTLLQEAKDHLRANWEKGTRCPCCGRIVKQYRHGLNAGMAHALIIMYQMDVEHPGEWVHVQNEFAKRGLNANAMGYSLLKWWELLEQSLKNDQAEKRANGYWRITQAGRVFVTDGNTMPSFVCIYSNKKISESDQRITIVEALGKQFDYSELMKGI